MKNHLPRLATRILERIMLPPIRSGAVGDFNEQYRQIAIKKGIPIARLWYWAQIIQIAPRFLAHVLNWRLSMLRNYIKITLRNINKHKGYAFINIISLSTGMMCAILILLWVQEETSVDGFHPHARQLYQIKRQIESEHRVSVNSTLPFPIAQELQITLPEIVTTARFTTRSHLRFQNKDENHFEDRVAFTEPAFLNMFYFPLIEGNAAAALSQSNGVVITQELAVKYFGTCDVIGKTIRIEQMDLNITGILKQLPSNSQFHFNCLVPFSAWSQFYTGEAPHRSPIYVRTYIRVLDSVSHETFKTKIADVIRRHDSPDRKTHLLLQPIRNQHLYYEDGSPNDQMYNLVIFPILGLLVLVVACANFINLSTARSTARIKEVGLRKVVGAGRHSIIRQFFGESIVYACVSLIFSLILLALLLPVYNRIASRPLNIFMANHWLIIAGLAGIALFSGILAGSYPALYISAFQPASVLKGEFIRRSGRPSSGRLRRTLIIIQFVFSIILIIFTVTMRRQIQYLTDLDYRSVDRSIVGLRMEGDLNQKYDLFKSELLTHPSIASVTACSGYPRVGYSFVTRKVHWQDKDPNLNPYIYGRHIHRDYLKTVQLERLQELPSNALSDIGTSKFVFINEAMTQIMSVKSPLGNRITIENQDYIIFGVLKNYHCQTAAVEIRPLILKFDPEACTHIIVRMNGREYLSEALLHIQDKWNAFLPDIPFEYGFLDDLIARRYDEPTGFMIIFNYVTGLALFISSLGLLGLAAYTTEQRTKEIGIRKVLGSTVFGVVRLLTKPFIRWILISNAIAWAASFFLLNWILQHLAYRIQLRVDIFLFAGTISIAAALTMISFQTIKAAFDDPVRMLRYE